MSNNPQPPEKVPEPGYYYHYKHDPAGAINNYAYYIYGVGHHTEEDCRPIDQFMLNYRPLYKEATVYKLGKMFDNRPLHMFYEAAKKDGDEVERFMRITDPDVIAKLRAIKHEMYPPED